MRRAGRFHDDHRARRARFSDARRLRKHHLAALARLLLQVLKLAEKAGLAKLGHVALDGAKIKANASKHKAMSYERMKTRETELRAEVDRKLRKQHNAQKDNLHGASRRGDEMPGWMQTKRSLHDLYKTAREGQITRVYRAHVLAALTKPLARRLCRLRQPPPSPALCRVCGGRARRSHRPALASPRYW